MYRDYVGEGREPYDYDEPEINLQEIVDLQSDELAKYRHLVKCCVEFRGLAFGYEIRKNASADYWLYGKNGDFEATNDIIKLLEDLDLRAKIKAANDELVAAYQAEAAQDSSDMSGTQPSQEANNGE